MAQNKGAKIRYRALDRCLRSRHGRYSIQDLISACSEALTNAYSQPMQVSRRQIYDDLNYMESDAGYGADIEPILSATATARKPAKRDQRLSYIIKFARWT